MEELGCPPSPGAGELPRGAWRGWGLSGTRGLPAAGTFGPALSKPGPLAAQGWVRITSPRVFQHRLRSCGPVSTCSEGKGVLRAGGFLLHGP